MAGTMTASAFDSPALTLLLQLEDEGFEMEVAEPDILRVRPVGRVTPELRADLRRYKLELVMLIRICDSGVQDRRQAFSKQIETAPAGVLIPRLVFRKTPYVNGRCHSCGEALERPRWGCCWRCALAWRLACRLPVPAALAVAIDAAKVCA